MDGSLGASDSENELNHELVEAGIKLLTPPSSTDELLTLLDCVENILSKVGQDPSRSMRDALFPSMKALISDELLKHPDMDVKVSVVSCFSELLRITAPHQPYDDVKMKEIFQLTVIAFEKLSDLSGHCYSKALQILETVAKIRACVMLLDLGFEALIVQIFQLLLRTVRLNHPHYVFTNMEEIMTWVIDESDDISPELLKPLLSSVKKENQNISPVSWKLGVEVLRNCSAKVKPYLRKAVKSMRLDVDDYTEIVALLLQDEPSGENLVGEEFEPDAVDLVEAGPSAVGLCKSTRNDGSTGKRNVNDKILDIGNSFKTLEHDNQIEQIELTCGKSNVLPEALKSEGDLEKKVGALNAPRKRVRKPNSPIKPEEGYEDSCLERCQNTLEVPKKRQIHEKLASSKKETLAKESPLPSEPIQEKKTNVFSPVTSHSDRLSPPTSHDHFASDQSQRSRRRGRPKKKEAILHVNNVDPPISQYHIADDQSRRRRGRPKKKESHSKGVSLLRQVKGQGSQDSDVALGVVSAHTEDAEEKPLRRGPRRIRSGVKSNRETTAALRNITIKKETHTLSDSEEKQVSLKDGKNAMEDKATLKKPETEEFVEKTMESPDCKLLGRDENLSDRIVKTKRRRKQTLQEKEGSKRLSFIKDYGAELVGSRLMVWWPLDQMFYEGVIHSFHPSKKRHEVLYVDGDKEILNLNKERWILLDDASFNQDQEAELPSSAVSPVKSQKEKENMKTKYKIKQENSLSSSKSGSKMKIAKDEITAYCSSV